MATREDNIKKINDELEILSDEQLEHVVGGAWGETQCDEAFFNSLGIRCREIRDVKNAFAKYGVDFDDSCFGANDYRIGGQKYPRMAAYGWVLGAMGYPGYNGNWGDCEGTKNFIREHISKDAV